jgi:hypothetical protein
MIRDILKMADPRLLRIKPVKGIHDSAPKVIVADMYGTTDAAKGVRLAPPLISLNLRLTQAASGTDRTSDSCRQLKLPCTNLRCTPVRHGVVPRRESVPYSAHVRPTRVTHSSMSRHTAGSLEATRSARLAIYPTLAATGQRTVRSRRKLPFATSFANSRKVLGHDISSERRLPRS